MTVQPPTRRHGARNGSRPLTRTLSSIANGPARRNYGHSPSTDNSIGDGEAAAWSRQHSRARPGQMQAPWGNAPLQGHRPNTAHVQAEPGLAWRSRGPPPPPQAEPLLAATGCAREGLSGPRAAHSVSCSSWLDCTLTSFRTGLIWLWAGSLCDSAVFTEAACTASDPVWAEVLVISLHTGPDRPLCTGVTRRLPGDGSPGHRRAVWADCGRPLSASVGQAGPGHSPWSRLRGAPGHSR